MGNLSTELTNKLNLLNTYYQISTELLLNLDMSNFSRLGEIESKRQSLLEQIFKIDHHIKAISKEQITPKDRLLLHDLCTKLDSIFIRITEVDQSIIAKILQEKQNLKDLISDFGRSEKLVRKFKSSWINPSGEKLDDSL